jgi:hypothetical protein
MRTSHLVVQDDPDLVIEEILKVLAAAKGG